MTMRITGMTSGLDTEAIIGELTKAYNKKTEKYEKAQTKLEWKQDAWKSLNTKIYNLYTNVSNLRFSSAYNMKKATVSDSSKATVKATGNAVVGTQKLNVLSTAQAASMTSGKLTRTGNGEAATSGTFLSDLGFTDENTSIEVKYKDDNGNDVTKQVQISKNMTVNDFVKSMNETATDETGVNVSFDEANGRFYINSKKTGAQGDFQISALAGDTASENALKALGLNSATKDADGNYNQDGAVKVDGTDAKIRLNGVIYTNSSNNFSINGLDITATGVTGDGDDKAITVTTADDIEGIYDKIKDFLTEYNSLINEMNKLYNAESAKGYEPLTDEEKDAMTDTEVKKWEDKIKGALFRRDTQLDSIMSAMKNSMSKTYEVDGKKVPLSAFGIKTLGFLNAADNEEYAFHIDGDEDDSMTSGNDNVLMHILRNDPDPENKYVVHGPEAVVDFLKQLTSDLYSSIDKKMKSTSLSSAYTVYNDKEMKTQHDEYTKTIKKWEQKAQDQEDRYYKQFSKMETALTKMQNSTQNIAGLFNT